MTEITSPSDSFHPIDTRQLCLAEAEHLYLLEEYKDAAIELITTANNGKYDFTRSISENFNLAHLSTLREAFSQDLYRQMAPAL
jgi:hypothetical protein